MNVILSVKPIYADRIMNERKTYEFRKTIFKYKNVDKVYVYASSPIQKLTGYFRIGSIIKKSPMALWRKCNKGSGINKNDFFQYFAEKQYGYAIKIREAIRFDTPVCPKKMIPNFKPPQSFVYTEL